MMRVAFEHIYNEGMPEDILLACLDQFCARNASPMSSADPRLEGKSGLKVSEVRIMIQCDDKSLQAKMHAIIHKYQAKTP